MRDLTVLSPHRDDAVFSLSIALRRWSDSGVRIRVLNFFTRSAYAPRAIACSSSAAELSNLRRREDRLALRTLHPGIHVRDYGFIDAPLRLELPIPQVMDPKLAKVREADIASISRVLPHTYVLAPLGIGDHVDHRSVRDAAIAAVAPQRLAFYEDLPYAIWTSKEAILERAVEIGFRLKRKYQSIVVRSLWPFRQIRRLAALYATQIAPESATGIAAFPAQYRHGVRIWVPEHSAVWLALSR